MEIYIVTYSVRSDDNGIYTECNLFTDAHKAQERFENYIRYDVMDDNEEEPFDTFMSEHTDDYGNEKIFRYEDGENEWNVSIFTKQTP